MENPYQAPEGQILETTGSANPKTWKEILFSFQGRIPRRQYWAGFGIQMLLAMVMGAIAFPVIFTAEKSGSDGIGTVGGVLLLFLIPLYAIIVWSSFAVSAKRWHDRNKSAWWILIGFIPYIGALWQLIECGCLRGTEGPNRFGDDPT